MLKDKPLDLADVGKLLGVNLVVEGDAQLSGDRLVIHAALVSVSEDRRSGPTRSSVSSSPRATSSAQWRR